MTPSNSYVSKAKKKLQFEAAYEDCAADEDACKKLFKEAMVFKRTRAFNAVLISMKGSNCQRKSPSSQQFFIEKKASW